MNVGSQKCLADGEATVAQIMRGKAPGIKMPIVGFILFGRTMSVRAWPFSVLSILCIPVASTFRRIVEIRTMAPLP
jgi:hypothetical protein